MSRRCLDDASDRWPPGAAGYSSSPRAAGYSSQPPWVPQGVPPGSTHACPRGDPRHQGEERRRDALGASPGGRRRQTYGSEGGEHSELSPATPAPSRGGEGGTHLECPPAMRFARRYCAGLALHTPSCSPHPGARERQVATCCSSPGVVAAPLKKSEAPGVSRRAKEGNALSSPRLRDEPIVPPPAVK